MLEKFGIVPQKVPKEKWSLEDFPDSLIQRAVKELKDFASFNPSYV